LFLTRWREVVPEDHLVRKIAAVLDLSWVHAGLAAHYANNGRPSIDPELMIRMLVIGYIFGIRSERALCRDVQVNLAYRWCCELSIEGDAHLSWGFRVGISQRGDRCADTRKGRRGRCELLAARFFRLRLFRSL
jgi:hypothetical protein